MNVAKNAVVTGSSKGLGRAIAKGLAHQGYNLFLHSRNEPDLEAFQAELNQLYPEIRVYYMMADISVKTEVDRLGTAILSVFRHIDVLVNNAGVYLQGHIKDEKEGTLENLMNTNLYSAYYLTRKLLSIMIQHRKGHIFNMCSIASLDYYPGGSSYSISKFALLGFSKCLREELKEYNIKVTSLLPGATWSNSWEGADLPKERIMEADDLAKVVLAALDLSSSAVIEEIILRPQLGDL
jgi:short-subunit dehydrogenase